MEQDIAAIKKRLETKIRETNSGLKEYTRDQVDRIEGKLTADVHRLDGRMRSLERLMWNRLGVFLAGTVVGVLVSMAVLLVFSMR